MRTPADQGLPSLGLVCQALLAITVVLGTGVTLGLSASLSGGPRLIALGILVAGYVRAGFHHAAAEKMRERSPEVFAALRHYAVAAAVTTTLIALGLGVLTGGPSFGGMLLGAMLGMYWPLTLWLLVHRRGVREAFAAADALDVPIEPADRSLEGAGLLMTLFATIGLGTIACAVAVSAEVAFPGPIALVLAVGTLVILLARSGFHLALGLAAWRGIAPERFERRARVYSLLAWLSVAFAVPLQLGMARWNLSLGLIGVALMVSYFLVAWPNAVRRVAHGLLYSRDGVPLPARDVGHSSDGGLTALGYAVIAFATASLATSATRLVYGGLALSEDFPWPIAMGAFAIHGLGLLAGLNLIRLGPRLRLWSWCYALGVLGIGVLELSSAPPTTEGLGLGSRGVADDARYLLLATIWNALTPIVAAFLAHVAYRRARRST